MSEFLAQIQAFVDKSEVHISDHGYDELSADHILVRDAVRGLKDAQVVEEYPHYPKGSCALFLERDQEGRPIHVVWGIPKGASSPAVVVTAYRPNPDLWTDDFLRRKK
jgi:hypothetical protein